MFIGLRMIGMAKLISPSSDLATNIVHVLWFYDSSIPPNSSLCENTTNNLSPWPCLARFRTPRCKGLVMRMCFRFRTMGMGIFSKSGQESWGWYLFRLFFLIIDPNFQVFSYVWCKWFLVHCCKLANCPRLQQIRNSRREIEIGKNPPWKVTKVDSQPRKL